MSLILYSADYQLALLTWIAGGVAALVVLIRLRRRLRKVPTRRKWVHAGLSVWFLLAALTLPELYCGLFYDKTDSFSLTNASQRWERIHVQTNYAGFRDDRPFYRVPPDDRKQIVFLGDSFTFGHGVDRVEDRFSDRIAVRLERERPGEFTAANVGIPGGDARGLLLELLPDLLQKGHRIDVLVYTVVMNDIEYLDERTAEFYSRQQQVHPRFFLFRDTYFYNLLYYRVQYRLRPGSLDYYGYLRESYESDAWDRLVGVFDQLRRFCLQNGIDLRIAVFPFLHETGGEYPFAEAHRRIVEYFESHGVRCLDLEPVLAASGESNLTVNRWDAHPNELAHSLAADAIRTELLGDLFDGSWGLEEEGAQ